MSKLIFGKSSSNTLYDELIIVLESLSGVKWGYSKLGQKVLYISSKELPVKISTDRRKKYDIHIINTNYNLELWDDIIRLELIRLLNAHFSTCEDYKVVINTINNWTPSDEYKSMLATAQSYPKLDNIVKYDEWLDKCQVTI